MYGIKLSIKEVFKSTFKIFGKNFFAVFSLSAFSVMLVYIASMLLISIFVSIGILDYSTIESLSVFKVLGKLSIFDILLIKCVRFFLLNLVSFLLVSAFLPAFRGSKITFRNYFPNSNKVFKAFLVTITLTAVLLGVFIFCANFFPKSNAFSDIAVSVLHGILVFLYIEILNGESILQSCRNMQEPLPKAIVFFILLGFIEFIIYSIPSLIPSISKSNTLLELILGIKQLLVILPLSTLALIGAYTQSVLPKSNT